MFSEHTNCAGCHHHNPIQCSMIARPYYHLLYSSKTKKMKNNNNKYDDDDNDDDDEDDDVGVRKPRRDTPGTTSASGTVTGRRTFTTRR